MSGISPPSDPSSSNSRSRSSPETSNPNATRVPAVVTSLVPRRIQLPSSRDAIRVDDSSDTSLEASQHNRFRQRGPHGPNPSNSPDEDNPVDLSATQATFLAGAAVTQAHHAATIADHASNVAIQSQLEAFQARQVIAQQQSDFGQVAAEMRDAASKGHLAQPRGSLTPLWLRGTGVRSCLSITSLNRPNNLFWGLGNRLSRKS